MKNCKLQLLAALWAGVFFAGTASATNPLILDQFTADPTARVFEGKIYLYPSHDIPASPGKGRPGWFCMEDYHVFSSENLTDWRDHGVILSQTNVDWVNPAGYSLWAPDCVFRHGKYYFYFPAGAKEGGMRIGVAVSDKPFGPFKPEAKPIEGVRGIDPCVLIDKDGSAYLYYAMRKIYVAKLKENMLELESTPKVIGNLPQTGLLEGPFVFERHGVYYLTYPHVQTKTERLEYSIGKSPLGPFEPAGVILDESSSGCWTVQQSIVEYKSQWYLFYHDKDLSPDFDKNRSVRADLLFFNGDGTIQKAVPTFRGVGVVNANSHIQIDRYSAASPEGVSVTFLDQAKKAEGWKVSLHGKNAWVRFNQVDFGEGGFQSSNIRAVAPAGGRVGIHLDKPDGPLLSEVELGSGSEWNITKSKLSGVPTGIRDLVVTLSDGNSVELDWINFEL